MKPAIVAIAVLLSMLSAASSQEEEADDPGGELLSVVGIAENDMLNLRATASPGGMLIARIPNGFVVRNLGCVEVGANRWCKVSDPDNPSTMGWAAERYLQPAAEIDAVQ